MLNVGQWFDQKPVAEQTQIYKMASTSKKEQKAIRHKLVSDFKVLIR